MTAVPNVMLLVRAMRLAKNIIGDGIGAVVAEKCSPRHSSSKPSVSASSDFSVSSSSVLQNVRSGGWTGIMNIPSRMCSPTTRLQNEPRQVRVLGEVADVLVHIVGVDDR